MPLTNTLHERMAEARATAEAAAVIRILNDAAMDPSTKRFTKGRGARIERWIQLSNIASQQVQGLQALAKATPKRTPKPRACPTVGKVMTSDEVDAVAEETYETNR